MLWLCLVHGGCLATARCRAFAGATRSVCCSAPAVRCWRRIWSPWRWWQVGPTDQWEGLGSAGKIWKGVDGFWIKEKLVRPLMFFFVKVFIFWQLEQLGVEAIDKCCIWIDFKGYKSPHWFQKWRVGLMSEGRRGDCWNQSLPGLVVLVIILGWQMAIPIYTCICVHFQGICVVAIWQK